MRQFNKGQKVHPISFSIALSSLYPGVDSKDPTKELIKRGWIEYLPDTDRILIKQDFDSHIQWEITLLLCQ